MKKRLLLIVGSLLAFGTQASATTTNDTITSGFGGVLVESLATMTSTASEVRLMDTSGNSISCEGLDNIIYIARAHARHQLMYDTLLAAKLSGRTVGLNYERIGFQCWAKQVILN